MPNYWDLGLHDYPPYLYNSHNSIKKFNVSSYLCFIMCFYGNFDIYHKLHLPIYKNK